MLESMIHLLTSPTAEKTGHQKLLKIMLLVFISKLVEKALHSINEIITPTYSDHNVISFSTSRFENNKPTMALSLS